MAKRAKVSAGNGEAAPVVSPDAMETLHRLDKDLKKAARLLGRDQVRGLVDFYYQIQRFRISASQEARQAEEKAEPSVLTTWIFTEMRKFEANIQRAMDVWTDEFTATRWCKSLVGVGSVITAGLFAHLDIRKAPTVGHFVNFAGLNPDRKWLPKTKRPWNAKLKRILWIFSECQKKFSNHKDSFYGQFYKQRKAQEIERNEQLLFKDQAEASLREKKFGKDTDAYAAYIQGKLPAARLDLRAERYVSKLFASHLHHVMHWDFYGTAPPVPYIFEHGENAPLANLRHAVLLRDRHRCAYCNFDMRTVPLLWQPARPGAVFEGCDHVLPRSQGGMDVSTNLVGCCEPCNARKAERTPKDAGMQYHAEFDVSKLAMLISTSGDHRHFIAPPNFPFPPEMIARSLKELYID